MRISIANNNAKEAPEIKYIIAQEPIINEAWPKSGCKAKMPAIKKASRNEMNLPGGPLRSKLDFITQPQKIMNVGLRNSEGCNETYANENHLTAPLP